MVVKKIYSILIITSSFTLISCIKGHEGYDSAGGNLPTNYVMINAASFSPATLTVAAGSSITFVNNDNAIHSIRTNDSTTILSNDIAPGKFFIFKKDTTGVFNYHCSQHPTVTGSFILTP